MLKMADGKYILAEHRYFVSTGTRFEILKAYK